MNKKFLSLLLVIVIALSFVLCACDGNSVDQPNEPCTNHVDVNVDGKCDVCGADVEIPFVCTGHVDFDENGKCDYCEESISDKSRSGEVEVVEIVAESFAQAKCLTFDLSFALSQTAQGVTSQGEEGKMQVKIQQTEDGEDESVLILVTVFGEPDYNFYFDGENIALEEADGEVKDVLLSANIGDLVASVVESIPEELLPIVLEGLTAVVSSLPEEPEFPDLSEVATELITLLNQVAPATVKFNKGVLSVNRKLDFADQLNSIKNYILLNKDTDLFQALLDFANEQIGETILSKQMIAGILSAVIDTENDKQTIADIVDVIDELVGELVVSEEDEPIEGTQGEEKSFFESELDNFQEEYGLSTSDVISKISQTLYQIAGVEIQLPAPTEGQSLYQYIHGLLEEVPVAMFWGLAGEGIDSNEKFAEAIATAISEFVITPSDITELILGEEDSAELWNSLLLNVIECSIATQTKLDGARNFVGLDVTCTFTIGAPAIGMSSAVLASYVATFGASISYEEFALIEMPSLAN